MVEMAMASITIFSFLFGIVGFVFKIWIINPFANGGTGLTSAPSMLVNLASTTATSPLQASPRPGVTGTLPIANGGTGQTTAAGVRNALGLGNTTGAVPIANGGTGATTAAAARTALGCAPAHGKF